MAESKDFYLRMPAEMHSVIADMAHEHARTLNSQFLVLLTRALDSHLTQEPVIPAAKGRYAKPPTRAQLMDMVRRLEAGNPSERDAQEVCRALRSLMKVTPLSATQRKIEQEDAARRKAERRMYQRDWMRAKRVKDLANGSNT